MKKSTMTIILMAGLLSLSLLTSCQGKAEDNLVKIATKPMTEQFLLGEMLAQLIESRSDIRVELIKGIGGGTSNIHPGLIKGEFDMYPEYTGTGWSFVLKKEGIPDDQTLYTQLVKDYKDQYNLEWVGLYGFNNTYGLVIRKDLAQQYGIKTYSDLANYDDQLSFGAEYDFYEREDGYKALCAEYGLEFQKHVDLDIGLKYNAINSKQIDVMNIFTTDGQLSVSDTTVLKDDKNFYQTYYCGTVVRSETLERYPELKPILLLMDNILDDQTMADLNYQVEGEHKSDKEVATQFLLSKGLLTES
ncbi:glycine betaine ABC transporter substrate-binding protein [Spirochaeta cellobiosiphila]|uniref:glycine betaine ABC transporter substrate-binding protein n=1 Tax=Spirochaeta cellobiosiphila TaxID=504483 RepID=UPI00042375C6|nr:glycine betaine ABC transporter substrate-binding protein [Spirochaeta cellobiosiphila]